MYNEVYRCVETGHALPLHGSFVMQEREII